MVSAPLADVRVIEMAGLGPCPHAGQVLVDMGAEVISVGRPGHRLFAVESRGKRSVTLDLKDAGAVEALLRLIETADILIEGYRPGVMERLGLGPGDVHARQPRLVYGRMTGWGQTGPLARMAGHDINYIGLTGALAAMGDADRPPPPPLNLVGDYGGGSMFLVAGVLAALFDAARTGRGRVIDAAIVDGTASMMGLVMSLHAMGRWRTARAANWLDGGTPYYRCYACRDGRFFAVGALEPQFFDELLDILGIDPDAYGDRDDPAQHPRQAALLAARFAERDRDTWAEIFAGRDACATPVLDIEEAAHHPHMAARGTLVAVSEGMHPHPAPRFAGQPPDWTPPPVPRPGEHTRAVLAEVGIEAAEIARLVGDA